VQLMIEPLPSAGVRIPLVAALRLVVYKTLEGRTVVMMGKWGKPSAPETYRAEN
jgi:hypothetical protein